MLGRGPSISTAGNAQHPTPLILLQTPATRITAMQTIITLRDDGILPHQRRFSGIQLIQRVCFSTRIGTTPQIMPTGEECGGLSYIVTPSMSGILANPLARTSLGLIITFLHWCRQAATAGLASFSR